MLENVNIHDVLFLDIETVPAEPEFENLSPEMRSLWERKASFLKKEESETPDVLYRRAGIYAEFGKIICICVGYFKSKTEFRIKSFSGDDEKIILSDFCTLLERHFSESNHMLCAHNGKEFDFPYLARRILINRLKIPSILDLSGKKPWEINHIDTMQLWRFGDYKQYTSLQLLAAVFNIPTPKDDIDGSDVWRVYHVEKNMERIVRYCAKDTLTIAQLFLAYRGEELLPEKNVVIT